MITSQWLVEPPQPLDDKYSWNRLAKPAQRHTPARGFAPRTKRAAKRLLRKLLKRQGRPPRVLVTDKLASYPAAKKELMPGIEHRRHKGLNNRAENSHQPTRRRE